METVTLKISSVNQVTLPRTLRELLGVKAGDELEVELVSGTLQLRKAKTNSEKVQQVFQELDEWRDALPQKVKDNIQQRAGWTANQYREYFDNTAEHKAYVKEKYGL